MQQPPQIASTMPSFQTANITTEQIQKFESNQSKLCKRLLIWYLEENKKLILAIMDNQNLGKINECAQYQALLQKNLMYLAAIADAQPHTPAMATTPMTPHPSMHQGAFFMQHPQAVPSIPSQPAVFSQRFSNPNQVMDPQQQQQLQHQMMGVGVRPGLINNGFNAMHLEAAAAAAVGRRPAADMHGIAGKNEGPEVLGVRPDGPGSSHSDQLDSDPSYLNTADDPK